MLARVSGSGSLGLGRFGWFINRYPVLCITAWPCNFCYMPGMYFCMLYLQYRINSLELECANFHACIRQCQARLRFVSADLCTSLWAYPAIQADHQGRGFIRLCSLAASNQTDTTSHMADIPCSLMRLCIWSIKLLP